MSKPVFEGSAVAIVTPFNEKGVDFVKLEKMVEFHIKNKTDAIVVCGSTGEASTMPDEEHLATIKCVIDAVNHRIPVIAGTGSNDTRHGVELTKAAAKMGADAVLLVTPYYNKCTPEGLVRHYAEHAANCDCPIILYNVPSRTNVNISAKVLERLADYDNIVGIKECNFGQVPDILSVCGDRYSLYSGEDALAVPLASLGGKGVISVAANILPEFVSTMMHAALNGDFKTASKMQVELVPLINSMFFEVNPIPVKTALNILGLDVGPCRLPLCEMTPALAEKMTDIINTYDISAIKNYFA
ncbi:MAG: 4-hydroxy-tetrahydrodipicolinate synthase [Clostridia bacterium]|nr:4-hydroxy-tetrahydrodipicolinate synthase [Clostridia bacterium]